LAKRLQNIDPKYSALNAVKNKRIFSFSIPKKSQLTSTSVQNFKKVF